MTITVTANPGPTLSYSSPQALAAGTSTTVNPATGPRDNGSVATIALDNVSPGTGLAASVNNTTGVVSLNATLAGSYTVNIKATDNCSVMTVASFAVNVTCPATTISPESLPNGTVNVAYFGSLAHVTPTNDYIITLQAGTLPPGLVIDNVQKALVGTPTAAGSYTFTLRATAPSGCYDDRIYTVVISGSVAVPSDFDGDRKSDPALFRATQSGWLLSLSGDGTLATPLWGAPGDQSAAGDYDGDGRVDLAVFAPATGEWRIKRSSDGATVERVWGAETDTPVPGDYDGDGKTDLAVWRAEQGRWLISRSSDKTTQSEVWGGALASFKDVPVLGDYDGDGKIDLAVWRPALGLWIAAIAATALRARCDLANKATCR